MTIDDIISGVLKAEGGYVDHPADRGGPTRFGITERTAREEGYHGPMRELPESFARSIYIRRYVQSPGFDRIVELDAALGGEVVDTGVNMGPAVAGMFLQRWLNGFNSEGRYNELFVDGRVGPKTAAALKTFLTWRGELGRQALLRGLNGVQATRYLKIAERDQKQRAFLFGWITHRVVI